MDQERAEKLERIERGDADLSVSSRNGESDAVRGIDGGLGVENGVVKNTETEMIRDSKFGSALLSTAEELDGTAGRNVGTDADTYGIGAVNSGVEAVDGGGLETVDGGEFGRPLERMAGESASSFERDQVAVGELETDIEGVEGLRVGEASDLQVEQRLADDLEDAKVEAGMAPVSELPTKDDRGEFRYQHRVMRGRQEKLTTEAVRRIEDEIKQHETRPAEIVKIFNDERNAMIETYARRLGERNG